MMSLFSLPHFGCYKKWIQLLPVDTFYIDIYVRFLDHFPKMHQFLSHLWVAAQQVVQPVYSDDHGTDRQCLAHLDQNWIHCAHQFLPAMNCLKSLIGVLQLLHKLPCDSDRFDGDDDQDVHHRWGGLFQYFYSDRVLKWVKVNLKSFEQ